jgi:hypothetical protein
MKQFRWTRRSFLKATLAAASGPMLLRGAERDGFSIGLVADAQYADIEPTRVRFYRKAVGRLREAVEEFNGQDLAFCAHLGDLIDREWRSFDEIMKPLAASRHRFHHLLGNHDFEVLAELKARVPGRIGLERRYDHFDHGGFRFVVLDTTDVSTYSHAPGTPEHRQGEAELARLKSANLAQARPTNGGVGRVQLEWFERMVRSAATARLRVIVLAHHPLLPAAGDILWNSTEVLEVIGRNPAVVAWLNGHNHAGAFAEFQGVPLVTMHGMVDTPDTTAFATAKVLPDRLIISGRGREPSRELVFRKA